MTSYSTNKVKLTVECSLDERVYIKSLAAKKHMTISEFILSYVRKEMPVNRKNREPNEETKQAMRDVDEEKNLGQAKTVEEFWSAMGMLEIKWTRPVKRDLKKNKHQKDVIGALQEIILLLVNRKPLPAENLDHPLTGNWVNHRECHVKNDVLLIYKTNDNFLYLSRFGSHSELF